MRMKKVVKFVTMSNDIYGENIWY